MRYILHPFDSLTSTQQEAKHGIDQHHYDSGHMILAKQQTDGYGRRGNTWHSPLGNFYASFIVDDKGNDTLNWLGFVVGLALYDILLPCCLSQDVLKLKWPNDVMLNGKKLVGMLIERHHSYFIIGMGINLTVAPEATQPTTHLSGAPPLPQDLARCFFKAFEVYYSLACTSGLSAIKPLWLDRCIHRLDEGIQARLPCGEIVIGMFIDLAPDGALMVQTNHKTHRIHAAEIFLGTQNNG